MLHLNFGLSFEKLAEDMMDKLMNCWKADPFKPPVVIFPDKTLEQWFKQKWMYKFGVLANLNTKNLEKFLFEALSMDGEDKPQFICLSKEILQNLILAWLKKDNGRGEENWCTFDLSSGNAVRHYLADTKSNAADEIKTDKTVPDESRLFDFAAQISRLFLEYEMSRPNAFLYREGIIDTWSKPENNSFFKNANIEREAWQRTLYKRIFTDDDSVLNYINRVQSERHLNSQFITLPQLFERCRNMQGDVIFDGASDVPVFMFWHAGIGQFYRVALHEYAKMHDIHAYIQNPCLEFWENIQDKKPIFRHPLTKSEGLSFEDCDEIDITKPDNALLAKWGRAGRDNIKLWCESVNYDFTSFDNPELNQNDYIFNAKPLEDEPEISQDTLLHQIQYSVAHCCDQDSIDKFKNDSSLTVHSAPSRIREVEHLHSEICRLLQKENARIQDILIVAPNMNDYRTAIYQIFASERSQAEQIKQDKKNKRNIENAQELESALYIPFTIIDGEPRESMTAQALNTLFQIGLKGFLSRPEFFELVRNPVVQAVRGITPEEVTAWEKWLSGMGVYRDRMVAEHGSEFHYEDWKIGIKRLLLARLTDCRVQDGDDIMMPYSDIESGNSDSLCHFVDAVDSLENFCHSCKERFVHGIDREALDGYIVPLINSWTAMNQVPSELTSESVIYQNVMKNIELMKMQYDVGNEKISLKNLKLSIVNAAQTSHYMVGTLFVNGLTFMNFMENRVIPIKHLFFLGLDAAAFPGRDVQNSLDLRMGNMWPGDNQNAAKNRYAFLGQMMSTSESLHLSYVNKDLQKDEEFFPSSIIKDLFKFISQSETESRTAAAIPLDEERDINELFTSRSLRNYNLYRRMKDAGKHVTTDEKSYFDNERNPFFNVAHDKHLLPERVSLSKLKAYLDDPFQFRIGALFQTGNDDIDPQKTSFEPVDLDNIELIEIIKIVAQMLIRKSDNYNNMGFNEIDQTGRITENIVILSSEEWDAAIERVMDRFMKDLRESGFRVNYIYEDLLKRKIRCSSKRIAEQMMEYRLVDFDDDNAVNLSIVQDLGNDESKTWMLQGTADWHAWGNESPTLMITSVGLGKNDGTYRYIKSYVCALALIIQKSRHDSLYQGDVSVELYACCMDAYEPFNKKFSISAERAEEILKEIYREAYILQYAKASPIKLLEDKNIKSFSDLEEELTKDENGVWKYFSKRRQFDLKTDIGYDAFNLEAFVSQWNDAKVLRKALIYPLEPEFALQDP